MRFHFLSRRTNSETRIFCHCSTFFFLWASHWNLCAETSFYRLCPHMGLWNVWYIHFIRRKEHNIYEAPTIHKVGQSHSRIEGKWCTRSEPWFHGVRVPEACTTQAFVG
ncbi:hypothetical protein CI102_5549 [Trichoderma harzianum]|nr:hypothetical protein CI102_5549 [Trichoderma harzianum]